METFIHPHALENRVRILASLSRNQTPHSKNEWSEKLGLSLTDVSYHVRYLEENLFLETAPTKDKEKSGAGRPGSSYQLVPDTFSLLVVLVDLPLIRLEWFNSQGVSLSSSEHFPKKPGHHVSQSKILNTLRALIAAELPQKKSPEVFAFIAFAGVCDAAVVSSLDGAHDWKPFHLSPHFSRDLGIPVNILTSASALAHGYAAHHHTNTLVLQYKTAEKVFRYAEVVDGRLRSGEKGSSGVLGHLPVTGFDGNCYCGAKGCLELFLVSNQDMKKKWAALAAAVRSGEKEAGLSPKDHLVFSIREEHPYSPVPIAGFQNFFPEPAEEIQLTFSGARQMAMEHVFRTLLLRLHPASQSKSKPSSRSKRSPK